MVFMESADFSVAGVSIIAFYAFLLLTDLSMIHGMLRSLSTHRYWQSYSLCFRGDCHYDLLAPHFSV